MQFRRLVRSLPLMFACAPWGAVGEFAASRHGALNRRQAASLGLTPKIITRLIRDGHLREPLPGVLTVSGAPASWRQQLMVPTLVAGRPFVAGFRSAAALHRLDGYSEEPIEVLTTSHRRLRLPELVIHRGPLAKADLVEIDGVACTGLARTLCDLGSVDPVARVTPAFNDAWRRGTSLMWLRLTAERLHRPGQSGTGVLLRLLDQAESQLRPLESVLEAQVERLIERAGLRGVVRQHTVTDTAGRFVARVDFAIPALRLAIEAHSRRFHEGLLVEERDAARDDHLHCVDWHTAYVTSADVRQPEHSARRLCAVVARRAESLDMTWNPRSGRWAPLR